VLRYLRACGYDGVSSQREVVALLAQDAGYTLHYTDPTAAQLDQYPIAMIQNQATEPFPWTVATMAIAVPESA
jgi:NO-binding membrane sensor protein with MHYT domain